MEKLQRLQELIKLSNDGLSREEFTSNFKIIIDLIKKLKESNKDEMESLDSKYTEVVKGIEKNYYNDIELIRKQVMDYCVTELSKIENGKDGENGKDADEILVTENATKQAIVGVIPLIPTIDDITTELPKLGTKIRDSLELLQGNERLEIDAIKNLREELDELRKLKVSSGVVGGGFNYASLDQHILDPYIPSGAINGANTDFLCSNIPSPASSLKVYRGGALQSLTEDYTLNNLTVTFLNAPSVGEIIKFEHRI